MSDSQNPLAALSAARSRPAGKGAVSPLSKTTLANRTKRKVPMLVWIGAAALALILVSSIILAVVWMNESNNNPAKKANPAQNLPPQDNSFFPNVKGS